MCVDKMVMEELNKRVGSSRVDRPKWSKLKKRKLGYARLQKAAVRKYAGLNEKGQKMNSESLKNTSRHLGLQHPSPGLPHESPDLLLPSPVDEGALPPCAMAPQNTTQYLMDLYYGDMSNFYIEHVFDLTRLTYGVPAPDASLSIAGAYTSLVSDAEAMDFQQRDFDQVLLNEM